MNQGPGQGDGWRGPGAGHQQNHSNDQSNQPQAGRPFGGGFGYDQTLLNSHRCNTPTHFASLTSFITSQAAATRPSTASSRAGVASALVSPCYSICRSQSTSTCRYDFRCINRTSSAIAVQYTPSASWAGPFAPWSRSADASSVSPKLYKS